MYTEEKLEELVLLFGDSSIEFARYLSAGSQRLEHVESEWSSMRAFNWSTEATHTNSGVVSMLENVLSGDVLDHLSIPGLKTSSIPMWSHMLK
jgi:hypothetical protein